MKPSYNIENKWSLDNYIYYKMILRKIKKQTITWYIAELLYLYFIVITEPNITGHIFLIPVFILVFIKDVIIFAVKKHYRSIVSLIINFIAFISMIAETGLFSGPAGIVDVLIINCSMVFPIVFCIIMFRNDLITESLSEISDYPNFREDFYKITDEKPYKPFDDSKKDIFLKKSLEQFQINHCTKILKIFVLGFSAVSMLLMIFLSIELMNIKNAKDYNSTIDYSSGKYVRVNISGYAAGEHYVNFFGNTTVSYWCNTNDNYVYITSSVKNFKKIKKLSEPKYIYFKTQKFDSTNIELLKDIVNKENLYISDETIREVKSKCEENVCFKLLDAEKIENKIWRYLMFSLTGLIIYILTLQIMCTKRLM